jgi:hypothetical protein
MAKTTIEMTEETKMLLLWLAQYNPLDRRRRNPEHIVRNLIRDEVEAVVATDVKALQPPLREPFRAWVDQLPAKWRT